MESIELLYGALWVAPPCYQDGGHSAPPRSLPACGADRLCLPVTDDSVALNRAPLVVSLHPCDRSAAHSDLMQTPPRSKEPSRGQQGSRGDKSRTNYRKDKARREVGIWTLMRALVRPELHFASKTEMLFILRRLNGCLLPRVKILIALRGLAVAMPQHYLLRFVERLSVCRRSHQY